jgi:hydrogenase maturation factor
MSATRKIFGVAALGSLAVVFNACGGGGGGGTAGADEAALRDYLESEEMQSDLDNLAEFAYYAEYAQVAPIAFMASDEGLFSDSVDKEEAEEYAEALSRMISKADEYEAAWARIDSMQALMQETPSLQKNGVGLLFAMKDFFRSLRGCGKGTREKAMAVAGELDKSEWKILFDGLDKNQKRGETDYLTWWKNFNNGDYDDISLQIYNRMYYNEETAFSHEAEFINKTVANTGKDLAEKAAAFEVEILKAALPDPVTDAMGKMETADKINTIVTKGKDMSAEELTDKAMDLFVDGYDDVKKASQMLGEDAEAVANLTKKVIDKASTALEESAVVTFADAGSSLGTSKIAIGISAVSGKVTIALGTNEDGKQQLVLKEAGEHLVSFLTNLGEKFTKKLDVAKGEVYKLAGEMNEKAVRDSLAAKSSASSTRKGKSSSSTEVSSSSEAPEESSSSMEISKDAKSIYGRWVLLKDSFIYKVTDEEQCKEVMKSMSDIFDGEIGDYSDYLGDYDLSMYVEDCENKEEPQTTASGQKMLFYSDGTLDCIDSNGDILGSYEYGFDESTGVFSYDDGNGNKSTGQVSADGTTLVFETVTDTGYKTITHRVVFEKESGDIEYFGDDE